MWRCCVWLGMPDLCMLPTWHSCMISGGFAHLQIAANGPPLARGSKGLKRTLMMTLVDKEAAQVLRHHFALSHIV